MDCLAIENSPTHCITSFLSFQVSTSVLTQSSTCWQNCNIVSIPSTWIEAKQIFFFPFWFHQVFLSTRIFKILLSCHPSTIPLFPSSFSPLNPSLGQTDNKSELFRGWPSVHPHLRTIPSCRRRGELQPPRIQTWCAMGPGQRARFRLLWPVGWALAQWLQGHAGRT